MNIINIDKLAVSVIMVLALFFSGFSLTYAAKSGGSGEDPLNLCDGSQDVSPIRPSYSGSAIVTYGENTIGVGGINFAGGTTQPGVSGCKLVINPTEPSFSELPDPGNNGAADDYLNLTAEDVEGFCFSDAVASDKLGCDVTPAGVVIGVRNFTRYTTAPGAETVDNTWYQMDVIIQQITTAPLTP